MARSDIERKGPRMTTLRGNCTSRSLWFAVVGSFVVLILCVGVVVAAPRQKSRFAITARPH